MEYTAVGIWREMMNKINVKNYQDRKAKQGIIKITVQIPKDYADRFKSICRKLVMRHYGKINETDVSV